MVNIQRQGIRKEKKMRRVEQRHRNIKSTHYIYIHDEFTKIWDQYQMSTFNERHISLKEKAASLTCIRKLKMSEYIFSAPGDNMMLSGQSTR